MHLSQLIIGGNPQKRFKKAQEFIQNQFDSLIIETTGGMEEVKNLYSLLSNAPTQSPLNVCIIKEAQNLSLEAQNALLKILEEAPTQSLLILTAPHQSSIISTMASRCQTIDLGIEESELKNSEKVEELARKIIFANLNQRLALGEGIELNDFLIFWRKILFNNLGLQNDLSVEFADLDLKETLNYLKKIIETGQLLEKNVNKKLALGMLALGAPKALA